MKVANRLGHEMRQHPDRVLQEAVAVPSLPDDEVAFLKEVLRSLQNPGKESHPKTTTL